MLAVSNGDLQHAFLVSKGMPKKTIETNILLELFRLAFAGRDVALGGVGAEGSRSLVPKFSSIPTRRSVSDIPVPARDVGDAPHEDTPYFAKN
jgi:hypothetical protein